MVLIVIFGLNTSSRRYNSRMEGSPKEIKMIDGEIVQKSSREWDSNVVELIILLNIDDTILNITVEVIRNTNVIE